MKLYTFWVKGKTLIVYKSKLQSFFTSKKFKNVLAFIRHNLMNKIKTLKKLISLAKPKADKPVFFNKNFFKSNLTAASDEPNHGI